MFEDEKIRKNKSKTSSPKNRTKNNVIRMEIKAWEEEKIIEITSKNRRRTKNQQNNRQYKNCREET
ncbi:MAG: hypothetical protein AB8U36_05180 [Rickettsia aeschlimannii]